MSRSAKLRCAALAWAAWLALPLPAPASPELRTELAKMAKELSQFLDGRGEDSIVIGQFSGPANFPTSSGPGITQMLGEELKKLGKSVKKRAKYGVKGQYVATEVEDNMLRKKVLAITLKGSVEDEFGKVLADFSCGQRTLKSEGSFVALMGAPVDMPLGTSSTRELRDKRLRKAMTEPQCNIRGTKVYASASAKYGMELIVDDQPRAPKEDEGLAYAKIDRGEIYAVRLINDSDLEAAVNLSIDGLNVFTFSELRQTEGGKKGDSLYSVWVVPPKSSVVIKGWHRNNESSDSFQVTEYAKTAAASIGQTANLGTITASFAASWKDDEVPPEDEPVGNKSIRLGDGTGFGPPVKMQVTGVKRKVGAIRSSVSVRYTK